MDKWATEEQRTRSNLIVRILTLAIQKREQEASAPKALRAAGQADTQRKSAGR